MRIKSQWFKDDKPRSAKQTASVMAFIVWRVAQNALKQMRTAEFDIDPGPQYFAFLSEFLVFLIQITDRIAYGQLEGAYRVDFTTALTVRVSEILEENEDTLLGPPAQRSYQNRFIDLFNERSSDYAEFRYSDAGADFAFLRYLGNRVMDIMVKKDQSWVIDQIMEIEAPDAIGSVKKGMHGLFDPGPQRERRASVSGD